MNDLSSSINNGRVQIDKIICDRIGCHRNAVAKLTVDVGDSGYIPISLCTTCIAKFQITREPDNRKYPIDTILEKLCWCGHWDRQHSNECCDNSNECKISGCMCSKFFP